MKKIIPLSISLILLTQAALMAMETVKFKSKDGIEITASLYIMHADTAPFIILFHQAGWSRGEYLEIAPKLNQLGFNCMAVDLRSGKEVNEVKNLTNEQARKRMKETNYLDSYQDMDAALQHAREYLTDGPIIIWGSSYSASLAIRLVGEDSEVAGLIAFSPGEYFSNLGQSENYIRTAAIQVNVPTFFASARDEEASILPIFEELTAEQKTFFVPENSGNHGSRALWEKSFDHKEYWRALQAFLKNWLPQ